MSAPFLAVSNAGYLGFIGNDISIALLDIAPLPTKAILNNDFFGPEKKRLGFRVVLLKVWSPHCNLDSDLAKSIFY